MQKRLMNWPMLALVGLVAAAALFGGGLLAGRALDGDDDTATPASQDGGLNNRDDSISTRLPRTGPFAGESEDGDGLITGAGGSAPYDMGANPAADEARGGGGYGGVALPSSYYGCEALLGGIITGGALDPASVGIEPRLLGEGFELVRVNLWAEGECQDDGTAASGDPVLETQWRHTETGHTVAVSQRILDEPVANVRWMNSASVVADGYLFTVNAWGNYYYAEDGVEPAPADLPATDGDDVGAASIVPPIDNAELEPIIEAALAQLAPSVAANCYYVQTEGSWGDLASFGIGDPRAAIPSGYTESDVNIYTFTPPADGCETNGAEAPRGDSFWAQWTNGSTGYLEVNAYRNPYTETESWPGHLDDWGANWNRDGYSFSVWGNDGRDGIGAEVIGQIARAIDPSFSEQCLVTTTPLDGDTVAGLGVGTPSAEGWEITDSNLVRRGVADGCPGADDYPANYELNWSLESDQGYIHVNGWISAKGGEDGESWGYIHDYGVEWGDGNRNFGVWLEARDAGELRDTLIAIATSVDPSLNPDTLEDGGGPRPLPVEPDGGIGSSDAEAEAEAAESGAR